MDIDNVLFNDKNLESTLLKSSQFNQDDDLNCLCLLPDISLEELHNVATQNLIASTQENIARQLAAACPEPRILKETRENDSSLEKKVKRKKKRRKYIKKEKNSQEGKELESADEQSKTPSPKEKKSFHCAIEACQRSFYSGQSLAVHMRTHTGERPFVCTQTGCTKGFTTAGNLRNHMRTHSGEKPFKCDVEGCEKSFTEYSSLKKHNLVHSGAKPFSCDVCGRTFSQSGSRNVHKKRAHSELDNLLELSLDLNQAYNNSSLSDKSRSDLCHPLDTDFASSIDDLESDFSSLSDPRLSSSFNSMSLTPNVIALPEEPELGAFTADLNDDLFLSDDILLSDIEMAS